MRLFLIRHGETVDNVAGLWAGSRDSELTNHGYQQAIRLGLHFQSIGLTFTHIFSSHLRRAAKTAGLIREAQVTKSVSADTVGSIPDVMQLPALVEQDFGSLEGKKWHEKLAGPRLGGREEHKGTPGFVDAESKESMSRRADTFLNDHLLPLLHSSHDSSDYVVAVVSHGVMLSRLWERLLLRSPPKSVSFSPEVLAEGHAVSLEHLGGWSNTGYLELDMQMVAPRESATALALIAPATLESALSKDVEGQTKAETSDQDALQLLPSDAIITEHEVVDTNVSAVVLDAHESSARLSQGWTIVVQTVNGIDHLKDLKRTRGGVGSARHDASQKNIDSFFKRRKVE